MDIAHHPDLIHPTAYVAPNATLVGQVHIAAQASVWFGCVLRGDDAPIIIGARTNIQDLTVIHADAGQPCTLGEGVTIGHRGVLHSATVENGALVGIGAIVLNGASVGREALVGAGALVTEGTVIPPDTWRWALRRGWCGNLRVRRSNVRTALPHTMSHRRRRS